MQRRDKNKYKDNQAATTTLIQDLGLDSGDEAKITAIGIRGKVKGISLSIAASSSSSSCASTSKNLPSTSMQSDKRRSELFHVHVITNHTKVTYIV